MNPSSRQKVAIITGASRGIGAGLVQGYRKSNFAVVGTARTIAPSGEPDYATLPGDITEAETARQVVDLALTKYGRIDTLINNAGVYIGKPFAEYTPADFAMVTSVNLAGFFYITQLAIQQMVNQRGGHIVNVSTSLVDQADRTRPAALAALTKAGLVAVARSLAIEFASEGVRANAVSLGVISTSKLDPASYASYAAVHPLGRMGEIDDVVQGILYLEHAPFVTGETLHIDGGQSAGH